MTLSAFLGEAPATPNQQGVLTKVQTGTDTFNRPIWADARLLEVAEPNPLFPHITHIAVSEEEYAAVTSDTPKANDFRHIGYGASAQEALESLQQCLEHGGFQ